MEERKWKGKQGVEDWEWVLRGDPGALRGMINLRGVIKLVRPSHEVLKRMHSVTAYRAGVHCIVDGLEQTEHVPGENEASRQLLTSKTCSYDGRPGSPNPAAIESRRSFARSSSNANILASVSS